YLAPSGSSLGGVLALAFAFAALFDCGSIGLLLLSGSDDFLLSGSDDFLLSGSDDFFLSFESASAAAFESGSAVFAAVFFLFLLSGSDPFFLSFESGSVAFLESGSEPCCATARTPDASAAAPTRSAPAAVKNDLRGIFRSVTICSSVSVCGDSCLTTRGSFSAIVCSFSSRFRPTHAAIALLPHCFYHVLFREVKNAMAAVESPQRLAGHSLCPASSAIPQRRARNA